MSPELHQVGRNAMQVFSGLTGLTEVRASDIVISGGLQGLSALPQLRVLIIQGLKFADDAAQLCTVPVFSSMALGSLHAAHAPSQVIQELQMAMHALLSLQCSFAQPHIAEECRCLGVAFDCS